MSVTSRAPRTLGEQMASRVGMINAGKALAYVFLCGLAYEKEGRDLNAEEVGRFFSWSMAKSYKDQARFRAAMPGEQTPYRVWQAAKEFSDAKREARNAVKAAAQLWSAPAVT